MRMLNQLIYLINMNVIIKENVYLVIPIFLKTFIIFTAQFSLLFSVKDLLFVRKLYQLTILTNVIIKENVYLVNPVFFSNFQLFFFFFLNRMFSFFTISISYTLLSNILTIN